jgi:acetylornithine deacetylase
MQPNEHTLSLFRDLVAFDTTSRNSNLELIEYVKAFLAAEGVDSELFHDDDGTKANLYAVLGPDTRPGVILSGHTDVVPVDGQDWSTDPFDLVDRDGRYFARGSADMKGFIAASLALVRHPDRRSLHHSIHFALSYDEEVGCLGVRGMLPSVETRVPKPIACIVGEPTMMTPVSGHKGKLSLRCVVHGVESHSGLPHLGANALEAAAEAVAHLKSMARSRRDDGPFDERFQPPYTTIHTGVLSAGTALNIVPNRAYFEFEFRHLPEDDPHALLEELKVFVEHEIMPEMSAVSAQTGFEWIPRSQIPGLGTPDDAPIVALVRNLTGKNAVGKVSFGTEGGLFEQAGVPTVICGPGDIADAHKPDEFVSKAQLMECERFLDRLVQRLQGPLSLGQ